MTQVINNGLMNIDMNNDDSEDIMAIFDSSENTDSSRNLWKRYSPDKDLEFTSENELDHTNKAKARYRICFGYKMSHAHLNKNHLAAKYLNT